MSVRDFYNSTVKPLSTAERLQLARLILDDIPPQSLVDYRSDWTEEDLHDLNRAGLSRWDEAAAGRAP